MATASASDMPEIAVAQTIDVDGNAVPRPTVGIAAAGEPTLPFHVALAYGCPAGTEPRQLFVSIADTAWVQETTGKASPQTIRLDVPLRQLQWLMQPALICANLSDQHAPDEVDGNGTRYFRLPASAAGYASVTCAGPEAPDGQGGEASAATSGAPLDVWLSCPAASSGEPTAP